VSYLRSQRFDLLRLGAYDDLTIQLRRWATGMGDKEHHD